MPEKAMMSVKKAELREQGAGSRGKNALLRSLAWMPAEMPEQGRSASFIIQCGAHRP
jgi:hypothetical protein